MKRVCGRPQREITVYLENGDHINTKINATVRQIVEKYLTKPIPMYYGEDPTMIRARSVVFHNEESIKSFPGCNCSRRERLLKIWKLSDATLKKGEFPYNMRVQTEIMPSIYCPTSWRESHFITPSMCAVFDPFCLE